MWQLYVAAHSIHRRSVRGGEYGYRTSAYLVISELSKRKYRHDFVNHCSKFLQQQVAHLKKIVIKFRVKPGMFAEEEFLFNN